MLPVLHIDEESLRPRIERAKLEGFRRSSSFHEQRDRDAEIVSRLVRSRSNANNAEVSSRLGMRRERCASCGEPVFLAEKLVVSRSVYHRSCFRCARCRHQLTPGNYYETEDGQYCCEACPIDDLDLPPGRDLEDDLDSQPPPLPTTPAPQLTSQREPPDHQHQSHQSHQHHHHHQLQVESSSEAALLEAPLSDEEKSKRRSLERQRLQLQQQDQQQQHNTDAEKSSAAATVDEHDHKFDHMLKLINDRIDQLTSDEPPALPEQPPPEAPSPPAEARRARDSRVHSAPDVVVHSRTTANQPPQHSTEIQQQQQQQTSLQRCSSLRLVSETTHTKDQQPTLPPLRRLSLGQHKRQLFEQQLPAADGDHKLEQSEQQPQEEPKQQEKVEEEKKKDDEDDYPDDLNPFASDDEEEEKNKAKPPVSTNPFGSDDDEEEEQEPPPKPMARTKSKRRILEAPQINLNPFWSDDEEPEEHEAELRDKSPPVPRPRTLRHSHADGMTSMTLPPKSNLTISSIHSSNTSIASSCSTLTPGGTYRKKKPAPPPPLPPALTTPPRSLDAHSNSSSLSPRLTPRTRKSKPAPPPPPSAATSTPHSDRYSTSALPEPEPELVRLREKEKETTTTEAPWQTGDNDKLSKDEANRNTRSLSCTENTLLYSGQLDKSLEGKWKRKKGPAPPRPMPLRRKIKVMSMKDVKLELDQIEMQQQGLERQGVRLEQIIRDKCESGTASEETSLGLDVEELVLELFALVNEKNELFRRQAELMLLRRQQRLEEEHADIEYQVRCLITQPEATKTDFDKQREETLIQRLVEIVEKRNEIVECLEMDRRREIEEDRSIHREMDLYAARNKAENINLTDESRRSTLKLKKGKVKEKVKEKKSKKSSKKDADKDVDETEAKLKRHTLRKWF